MILYIDGSTHIHLLEVFSLSRKVNLILLFLIVIVMVQVAPYVICYGFAFNPLCSFSFLTGHHSSLTIYVVGLIFFLLQNIPDLSILVYFSVHEDNFLLFD